MSAIPAQPSTHCPHCGQPYSGLELVCTNCGMLRYQQQLNDLSYAAQQQEASDPAGAAMLWRQSLNLLPPG